MIKHPNFDCYLLKEVLFQSEPQPWTSNHGYLRGQTARALSTEVIWKRGKEACAPETPEETRNHLKFSRKHSDESYNGHKWTQIWTSGRSDCALRRLPSLHCKPSDNRLSYQFNFRKSKSDLRQQLQQSGWFSRMNTSQWRAYGWRAIRADTAALSSTLGERAFCNSLRGVNHHQDKQRGELKIDFLHELKLISRRLLKCDRALLSLYEPQIASSRNFPKRAHRELSFSERVSNDQQAYQVDNVNLQSTQGLNST